MLVKTNKTNKKGEMIYTNVLTGKSGVLPYHRDINKGGKMPNHAYKILQHPIPVWMIRFI